MTGRTRDVPTDIAGKLSVGTKDSKSLQRGLIEAGSGAIAEAFDCLPIGVILVDAQCDVLFMNQSAADIVGSSRGLTVRDNRLQAATCADTTKLRKLIAEAAQGRVRHEHDNPCGAMPVARRSMLRPLSVVVAPLRRHGKQGPGRAPAVVIFASDPESEFVTPYDYLVELYGLTRAEAAITLALLQGQSLEHAASRASISKNTARTHLKRVFDKTRTNRQAELVRLILRSPVGLRFD